MSARVHALNSELLPVNPEFSNTGMINAKALVILAAPDCFAGPQLDLLLRSAWGKHGTQGWLRMASMPSLQLMCELIKESSLPSKGVLPTGSFA